MVARYAKQRRRHPHVLPRVGEAAVRRSSADLTAHAIRAWLRWDTRLSPTLQARVQRATETRLAIPGQHTTPRRGVVAALVWQSTYDRTPKLGLWNQPRVARGGRCRNERRFSRVCANPVPSGLALATRWPKRRRRLGRCAKHADLDRRDGTRFRCPHRGP